MSETDLPQAPPRPDAQTVADVDGLLANAWAMRASDSRQFMALATEALALAQQLDYPAGSALGTLYMAIAHNNLSEFSSALQRAREAGALFAALADETGRGRAYNTTGTALWRLGDYAGARREYEASLAIFRRLGDLDRQAGALNNLGNITADQGNYVEALQYYLDSHALNLRAGQAEGDITILNNLGETYEKMGDFAKSLEYHLDCLRLIKAEDRHSLSLTSLNLGGLYRKMGDDDNARRHLHEAHRLGRAVGNRQFEALALGSLAELDEAAARQDDAARNYQAALIILREIGDKQGETNTLRGLGHLRWQQGDTGGALADLDASVAIADELGDPYLVTKARLTRGLLRLDAEGPGAAAADLEAALASAQSHKSQELVFESHRALSAANERRGDTAAALTHLQQAYAIEKTVFSESAGRRLQELAQGHQIERSRQEAEIAQLKNVELARANQELADLNSALHQANAEKSELLAIVQRLAVEDSLTGLNNRRHFDAALRGEYERAKRFGRELSLGLADLDHFKRINDRFLHQTGDAVLKIVATIIRQAIRGVDSAARYGGEEFVLLFPETGAAAATLVCEKIRRQIEEYPWGQLQLGLQVTISFGLSDDLTDGADALLKKADEKLYAAKAGGRNRLCA